MKFYCSFFSKNWPCSILVIVTFFFSFKNLKAQTVPVKQWDKTFGGSENDELTCLLQTCDGGYILGGYSKSGIGADKNQPSKGKTDYWVVRLDATGKKKWDKTFGGSEEDELYSIEQTADGGFLLGGSSDSGIGGDKSEYANGSDYWIVKIDSSGNKLWDKTYGGYFVDRLHSFIQTSDGGYMLGGDSESDLGRHKTERPRGFRDYWVIKLDANGNKMWDKTYGSNESDHLFSLQQTSDGGYILGGWSYSGIGGEKSQASKGDMDFWFVKIDASGNKVWDRTFGGSKKDEFTTMYQTSDGGYILGGTSYSGISGDKTQNNKAKADRAYTGDYWIIKLDANGNKIWDKTIGGDSFDYLHSLKQTADGGYILGGYSESNISGDKSEDNNFSHDYWIVKLDANGNIIWEKIFGGRYEEYFSALQQTFDGGYILGGRSYSDISFDKTEPARGWLDYWVIKLEGLNKGMPATLTTSCNNGITTLNLNLNSIKPGNWTLTYTADGVLQTVSGNTPTFTLVQNATLGSVYSLVSVLSGNCKISLTHTLDIQSLPASPAVTTGTISCSGSVTLTATGAPMGGTYVWYDVATGGKPLYSNPSGTFTTPELNTTTTYYVAATTNGGCEGPRSLLIASVTPCPPTFFSNIITPNNDGKNDTFQPQNLQKGKWQLQIYNRWGVKLFESEDYQNNWPDKKIADGTYYYLLKNGETGKLYKGWVEVMH